MEMKGSVSPEPSNHLKVNPGLPLLEEASYLHSSMQESRALNIPQEQSGPAGVIALAGRKFFWHANQSGCKPQHPIHPYIPRAFQELFYSCMQNQG